MSEISARLFVWLQRLLPKYLLTSLLYGVARIRRVAIKDFLIRRLVALYDVDVSELARPVPEGYTSLNDFFTRELAPGARPVDGPAESIVSPVDGTVSACGHIDRTQIFQAKGRDYSIEDLLATDTVEAENYIDGAFVTIYLAPYNYHRVHAPFAGRLAAARYVPGALYSVNEATVQHLSGLFTRNERLICHIRTGAGPMVLIFVGATNVGTIHSIWTGDVRPRRGGVVEDYRLRQDPTQLEIAKGDLLGWFNMGSTVILLLPPGVSDAFAGLKAGQRVHVGEAIGRLPAAK